MTPEGKVKEACKKYLKSIGAWYFMPVSNGMAFEGLTVGPPWWTM